MVRVMKMLLVSLGLLMAMPVHAQEANEGFAEWFAGDWRGVGAVSGNDARATLNIAPVLGSNFIELDYRFTTVADDGSLGHFSGRGFYRLEGAEAWTGHWYDSTGSVHALAAALEGDSLVANWGERGRSEYRRVGDDRLEVVDSFQAGDGSWREFARITYVRSAD